MPALPDPVRQLAESQHGVVARYQLRAVGLSNQQICRMVHHGWDAVSAHVMRRAGSPPTAQQRVAAAVLDAGPTAFLGYQSACTWWTQQGAHHHPVHVTLGATAGRSTPYLAVVHRMREVPERWVTELWGVRVARPELVALQLSATLHSDRAERLIDGMWSRRLLTGRSVGCLLEDLGARGRNGTAALRVYHDARGDDYVPPASGQETRMMFLAAKASVPLERQVNVGDDTNWLGRVDFRHPHLPLLVEVQSDFAHASKVDREADAVRIAGLEAAGFEVVKIVEAQLWQRGDEVVHMLRVGVGNARRRAGGRRPA